MKRLDELGISPYPWTPIKSDKKWGCGVKNNRGKGIAGYTNENNANLIAAAPDMYKTEYDLVDVIERLLNGWTWTCDTPSRDEVVATIEAAKEALAKAAGEEDAK